MACYDTTRHGCQLQGMPWHWHGMVYHEMAWYIMRWHGISWDGMVRHDLTWHGIPISDIIWYIMTWLWYDQPNDMLCYTTTWPGVAWLAMTWLVMTHKHGKLCHGVILPDIKWWLALRCIQKRKMTGTGKYCMSVDNGCRRCALYVQ